MKKRNYVPLRDWSMRSYDPETGRAAPSTTLADFSKLQV